MNMFRRMNVPTQVLCGILLVTVTTLYSCTTADGATKVEKYPTGNVNFSPFDKWLNAYKCLQTVSCESKYQLTYWGWKNLTSADTQDYCRPGGCKDQTLTVLTCISLVKPDFKFVDKTTVKDVNNTIIQGCASGFTGTVVKYSGARNSSFGILSLIMSAFVSLFMLFSLM